MPKADGRGYTNPKGKSPMKNNKVEPFAKPTQFLGENGTEVGSKYEGYFVERPNTSSPRDNLEGRTSSPVANSLPKLTVAAFNKTKIG